MIDLKTIESYSRDDLNGAVRIAPDGVDRYIVYTRFTFDDGDHFVVILKQEDGQWYFTDEGHTSMRMGCDGDEIRMDVVYPINAAFNNFIRMVAHATGTMIVDEPIVSTP